MRENKKLKPPSELFEDHVRCAGSLVIDCELCGRTHFGDGRGDYDEGELDKLLVKALHNPDKYIQHFDDDMVSWGYINGKQAVIGCPCNELYRYEAFILDHANLILRFLAQHARRKLVDARDMSDAVQCALQALTACNMLKPKENPNGKTRVFDLT